MRFDVASEEVRNAAKDLRFNLKDLVPVPDKKLRWRVPKQKLKEKRELGHFMNLYFKQEAWCRVFMRVAEFSLQV